MERRRRDKINMWIVQLGNLIPECSAQQQARQPDSKGGILSKACDYITELQSENQEMEECLKDFDEVRNSLQVMNQQFEQLKQENQLLRSHLQQQHFVDHSFIAENPDTNGVVLLDDATMVMEGNDSNNNFVAKYNFLNSNNDEDALYTEGLSVEPGTLPHSSKHASNLLGDKVTDAYNIQSTQGVLFANKNLKASNAQSSSNKTTEAHNSGNFKTIILKNVQSQKKRTVSINNQAAMKKSKKL